MKRIFLCIIVLFLAGILISCETTQVKTTTGSGSAYRLPFEMVIQGGHNSTITSISHSPDGKNIVSASEDGTIKLWDSEANTLKTVKGHGGSVNCIAFSSDGMMFVSASDDKTIKLWDTAGNVLNELLGHEDIVSVVGFSPDNNIIISGSWWDGTIRFWEKNGREIKKIKNIHRASQIVFSHDGKMIAVLSENGIKIWDSEGRLLKTIAEYGTSIQISRDSSMLRVLSELDTGKGDMVLKLYSLEGNHGKLLDTVSVNRMIAGKRNVSFSYCSLDRDGEYLVAQIRNAPEVEIWSFKGERVKSIPLHDSSTQESIFSMSFSPDGEYFAAGQVNGGILFYSFKKEKLKYIDGNPYRLVNVDVNTTGTKIIKHWQAGAGGRTGIRITGIAGNILSQNENSSQHNVVYSPDGSRYISGNKLFSVDGGLIKEFRYNNIVDATFSPDGKLIALSEHAGSDPLRSRGCCETHPGNKVHLYSVEGVFIRSFEKARGGTGIKFTPDGKHIIFSPIWSNTRTIQEERYINTYQDNVPEYLKAHLYGLFTLDGRHVRDFEGEELFSISRDGKFFVAGFGGWDVTRVTYGHGGNVSAKHFKTTGDGFVISKVDSKDVKHIECGSRIKIIDFGLNNTIITVGREIHDNSRIKLWDVYGKLLREFTGHTAEITGARFIGDGERIVSSSYDGTVKIWDAKSGDHATMLSFKDEWIIYTPDGYFDSSRDGGRLVSMVKDMKAYGVDQFAVRNNRPDIILQRFGGSSIEIRRMADHYFGQFNKRLRRLGMRKEELSSEIHVPETTIVDRIRDGKFVEVNFRMRDSKYSIKRYNVFINDVPIYGTLGKEAIGNNINQTERIELAAGNNKIEISCINEKGAESYRAMIHESYKGPEKSSLYFIGFGVSKYSDGTLDLKYAHKDVLDLEKLFMGMKRKYTNVFTRTFIDEAVTIENIKSAKAFIENAGVDDTFVLFIAGHGVHDLDNETTYYYLTHNTDIKNLRDTAANFELVEDLLQGIKPRNKLFLMDTCESGEVDDSVVQTSLARSDGRGIKARTTRALVVTLRERREGQNRDFLVEKNRYIYNDLLRRSGAIVFSSSRGGEFSYESDKYRNGHFTREIINAFDGRADKNKDGMVSVDELRDYVAEAVPRISSGLQHPTVDRDNVYIKFGFPKAR